MCRVLVLIVFVLFVTSMLLASGKIAIDGLHGLPDGRDYDADLVALFPNIHFIPLGGARIPIYNVLAEGAFRTGEFEDTIGVDIAEGVHTLYFWIDESTHSGQVPQLTIPQILGPDQSIAYGGYGICHVDNPIPGHYVCSAGFIQNGIRFRIGTGPSIWEVYPPEDYDAVLDLRAYTWAFFAGNPTFRSPQDYTRLQQMLDVGGSVEMIYDGAEPIALKPIIHYKDFTRNGASLKISVPGRITYSVPEPASKRPLTWTVPSGSTDGYLYYESEFRRPLNFIAREGLTGGLSNRSWADAKDVMLIEYVPDRGSRISEIGTLKAGEKSFASTGSVYTYFEARNKLNTNFRKEALDAGLTPEETTEFLAKYGWASRLMADVGSTHLPMVIYHLDGNDYNFLFPLQCDPPPTEQKRVIWVTSILPATGRSNVAVHPRVVHQNGSSVTPPVQGSLHEYGFFRETYGGDALDDMDAWGWHLYDESLVDSTDNYNWEEQIIFHEWGDNPLSVLLGDGVGDIYGSYSSIIESVTDQNYTILSGDNDTHSMFPDSPFQEGSHPPVVIARQEQSGGRLIGMTDINFIMDRVNNIQFLNNVFSWLSSGPTGEGPDIDFRAAVIETTLVESESGTTDFYVYNIGDAPLTINTILPTLDWVSAAGPWSTTIAPGDSTLYTLSWSAVGMPVGYHSDVWHFSSDDPNESLLDWPIRLHVLSGSPVSDPSGNHLPGVFRMSEIYPNPFNLRTSVSFSLPRSGTVSFRLFNLLGQSVEQFPRHEWTAGTHSMPLDFTNRPAGLYFLRADYGGSMCVCKLMLLK